MSHKSIAADTLGLDGFIFILFLSLSLSSAAATRHKHILGVQR
jgi:hypothetical protein